MALILILIQIFLHHLLLHFFSLKNYFRQLLGSKTGIDLLRVGIEHGLKSPVILLTGKGDQRIDVEAMTLGAYDYLVKSELDSEKLELNSSESLSDGKESNICFKP